MTFEGKYYYTLNSGSVSSLRNLQGEEVDILLAVQGKDLFRDVCNTNSEALTILDMQK